MKIYARIQDGRVAELLTTDGNPSLMFHPSLIWIDASSVSGIAVGWEYDGTQFCPPSVVAEPAAAFTLSGIQAQLAFLSAQLASLAKQA